MKHVLSTNTALFVVVYLKIYIKNYIHELNTYLSNIVFGEANLEKDIN